MAKRENTTRINVTIRNDLLEEVDKMAEEWSVTRTGAVCVMISEFLKQSKAMQTFPTISALFQQSSQNIDDKG